MQADKPYTLNNNTLENCSIGFELDSDNLLYLTQQFLIVQ